MADDDAPRPGAGGDDGAGDWDLDAEFTAMVAGLDFPDADELVQETGAGLSAGDTHSGSPADPLGSPTGEDDEPTQHVMGTDPADVPHNSYRIPVTGTGAAEGDVAGDGLSDADRADLDTLLGRDGSADLPRAVKIAVVLTPLASAEALAGLCAMSDLACWVVPARSGAYAVKEFVSAHAEWDVAELLGGMESEPAEAAELAGALSRLARGGVVLLTADLATDVGIESGLSGHITARHYVSGRAGEETSAGLVMSAVDASVEDVLFGIVKASEVPGALDTTDLPTGRAFRLFGRGLRRSRGQRGDQG